MKYFDSTINYVKSLFATPRMVEVSIEKLDFPETYKVSDLYPKLPFSENISGSQIGAEILNIGATQQRDDIIYQHCVKGNMPFWMNNFVPITVSDKINTLTYFVAPDVLCVGNGSDFLRVSLNGYTARKIVDAFDCILPTKKMSDQIWTKADLKLMPVGMGASYQMTNIQTLINHHNTIEKQRANRNFVLLAGHKKDIVYTKHLLVDKTRLAIYGWHYPDGHAIQGPRPNSTSHSVLYQDYSSSIRLISQKAILNQQIVNMYDILNNKEYATLISDEGAMDASQMYRG